MSKRIGDCDVDGCELPCCATHNHARRHGTTQYGGCKCYGHVKLAKIDPERDYSGFYDRQGNIKKAKGEQ